MLAFAIPASADTSDDQTIAEDSVLTVDDVPPGFEQEPSSSDSEEVDAAACRDVNKATRSLEQAPNEKADFEITTDDSFSSVYNVVAVFASTKKAKAAYAVFAARRTTACFKASFEAGQSRNVPLEIERSTAPYGDQAVMYEVTTTGKIGSRTVDVFATVQFVRVGRAIAGFGFSNTETQPPPDDVADMTDIVVTRLEDAL